MAAGTDRGQWRANNGVNRGHGFFLLCGRVRLQILYGVGFSEEDLKATVPVIFSNVISSMQALVKATTDFSLAVAATVGLCVRREHPSLAPIDVSGGRVCCEGVGLCGCCTTRKTRTGLWW